MGTTYHISIIAPLGDEKTEELQRNVDHLLVELNNSMSTYIASSELSLLNRSAINQWQRVSTPLLDVLRLSESIYVMTDGAFDVTVGPLVNAWGFGPDFGVDSVPSDAVLKNLMSKVDASKLLLKENPNSLKRESDLYIDLSAVAKGYGVDKVAELISEKGYNDFLVEIGGEIRVSGFNKYQKPWRIGIERPTEGLQKLVQKAIPVTDIAIATSGDYRNYFVMDNKRYSHTIDPKTGRPVTHDLVSVTVLDPLCARADALATAFNVMGHERALPLANSLNIAAFFIIQTEAGFTEFSSNAFNDLSNQVESLQH